MCRILSYGSGFGNMISLDDRTQYHFTTSLEYAVIDPHGLRTNQSTLGLGIEICAEGYSVGVDLSGATTCIPWFNPR